MYDSDRTYCSALLGEYQLERVEGLLSSPKVGCMVSVLFRYMTNLALVKVFICIGLDNVAQAIDLFW